MCALLKLCKGNKNALIAICPAIFLEDSQSISFIEHKRETRQYTDFRIAKRALGIFISNISN